MKNKQYKYECREGNYDSEESIATKTIIWDKLDLQCLILKI